MIPILLEQELLKRKVRFFRPVHLHKMEDFIEDNGHGRKIIVMSIQVEIRDDGAIFQGNDMIGSINVNLNAK